MMGSPKHHDAMTELFSKEKSQIASAALQS